MANSTVGFGAMPTGRAGDAAPTFGNKAYPILATQATTIARGDLVTLNASGQIQLALTSDTSFLGVFMGGYKTDTLLPQRFTYFNAYVLSAGAVAGSVWGYVIDDPMAEFYARASAGPITQADVGANVTFVQVAPDLNTGLSKSTLGPTPAVTATLPWRITSVQGPIGNDPASANNIVKVKLNASALGSTTGL